MIESRVSNVMRRRPALSSRRICIHTNNRHNRFDRIFRPFVGRRSTVIPERIIRI